MFSLTKFSRRSTIQGLLGSTLLFFIWHLSAQQQRQTECREVTLNISLKAGQSYQQPVGGNLMLTVRANGSLKPPNGWTFSLYDSAGHDYIAPVNLPLRFNPLQILGPGYGLTARESLKMDRGEMQFILSESDYKRIEQLWRYALWPYSAPDPDHAADNYVTAIKELRAGWLRVKTVESDISPDDIVRSAIFVFELTALSDFQLNPALEPKAIVCPVGGK